MNSREGLIVEVNRRTALVRDREGLEFTCQYNPTFNLKPFSNFSVGDNVLFTEGNTQQEPMILEILPRINKISRPGPKDRAHEELVLAANIDRLLIVMALKNPDFNPRLLDRYLVIAEQCGLNALICLNKCDLYEGLPEEIPYLQELGYPVVVCSAKTGEGLEQLKEILAGQIAVLSGPSGAGKSSMIKVLCPDADPLINEVRKGEGKGRHTTTSSHVYTLSSQSYLIDTPGIRELGIWGMAPENLASCFRDFVPYLGKCKFRNCHHHHEPGCALLAAAQSHPMMWDRYQSYWRILDSLAKP